MTCPLVSACHISNTARNPQRQANRRLARRRQPIVCILVPACDSPRVQRPGTKLQALATTPAVAAHGGTIALQRRKVPIAFLIASDLRRKQLPSRVERDSAWCAAAIPESIPLVQPH